MAGKLRPRISLRGVLLIVTLVCLAFTWRALCKRQLDSLTQAAHTDDFPAAIAVLDSEATRLLTGHTPLEKLRSLRVSHPSSKKNIELAVWGLGTVALDTQSQPFEIEPPDTAGLVFYKVSVNAFEGKLRPWGLTNLRYSGEFIATEARMARANPRRQTK